MDPLSKPGTLLFVLVVLSLSIVFNNIHGITTTRYELEWMHTR